MTRSRLLSVREKREFRQAIGLIFITLVLLVGFVFWGLPGLARLVGNTLIKQSSGPSKNLELKPTMPVLSDIPEATNSASLNIDGFAQPGVEVSLYVNSEQRDKMIVTDSGSFEFSNVKLTDGENTIYTYAENPTSKLESDQSKQHVVVVDTKKPVVTITTPSDNTVFHTSHEQVVTISGSVDEEGVKIYVGERMAIVTPEKTFTLAYQLVEGDQDIPIKATDKAGNQEEMSLHLRWEP